MYTVPVIHDNIWSILYWVTMRIEAGSQTIAFTNADKLYLRSNFMLKNGKKCDRWTVKWETVDELNNIWEKNVKMVQTREIEHKVSKHLHSKSLWTGVRESSGSAEEALT